MADLLLQWQAALGRVGVHTPFGRDAVGAAVLVGLGLLLSLGSPLPADRPVVQLLTVGLVLASAGALAWRRRAPKFVFAVALLSLLGGMLLDTPLLVSPFAAVAAYTVGAYCRQRHAAVTIAARAVAVALVGLGLWRVLAWAPLAEAPLPAALSWASVLSPAVLTVSVPALLGAYVQTRRAYTAALEQHSRDLERQREERARRAVAEERGQIAREVHDVAAHHLSELMIQAGAAERQATDHPDAQQALADIRQQASTTLAELRRVIDALRVENEGGEREPPPSIARADRLVEDARRAGCDVSLTVDGDQAQALPSRADRAAYRVLQEALANACRKASGATVTARLRYTPEALEVDVANTSPASPASTLEDGRGQGLAGLRERVVLAGGALTVAPTREGGWRVHATLPTTLTPAE